RTVAFVGAESPVYVSANAPAVADAIRNLIENGILHSPPMGEVAVTVHSGGCVSVADTGAGVPLSDRERIFYRLCRGGGTQSARSGLGPRDRSRDHESAWRWGHRSGQFRRRRAFYARFSDGRGTATN